VRNRALALLVVAGATLVPGPRALAQPASCAQVVVFALPGMTWADVARYRPPNLLAALADGSKASMSVRTNSARTSYASGFATIGGGARVDGGRTTGGPQAAPDGGAVVARGGMLAVGEVVGGADELRELAEEQGYDARPGALAGSLSDDRLVAAIGNGDAGSPPPVPVGRGRWALLAAMTPEGVVSLSATGPELLDADAAAPFGVRTDATALEDAVDRALDQCAVAIVSPGDLERVDEAALADPTVLDDERAQAAAAADALLGHVMSRLDADRDLLLVVSPTSPWWEERAQLGIAVARGPGYPAGSTLESASTRRTGFVTLPDVAPTILEFLGVARPPAMNGRPWIARPAGPGESLDGLVEQNEEAVFVDSVQSKVSAGFVIFQVLVYACAIALLASRRRRSLGGIVGALEVAALSIAAFPVATYLAGGFNGHAIGTLWYVVLLTGLALFLTAILTVFVRNPLDRLLGISAFTVAVLAVDLFLGARLQIETVFGYSPIVAGRFAGIGNIAFAVLAAAGLLTGTLLVHRWRDRRALGAAAALFAGIVVLDGAPQLGSDVGGVIALVPGLGITLVLLSGRRPSWRTLLVAAGVALVCLTAFLAVDLSRPLESQTHLARLFEDVRMRGLDPLMDTIRRKAEANLRVFRSSIWTLFVPPALAVLGWLLLRPRGRWRELAAVYPKPRAGLAGGLVLAVLAFAVNDSGIVIPAVILSFLVPMALMVHLLIESSGVGETAR
jgi:hypothetical protein